MPACGLIPLAGAGFGPPNGTCLDALTRPLRLSNYNAVMEVIWRATTQEAANPAPSCLISPATGSTAGSDPGMTPRRAPIVEDVDGTRQERGHRRTASFSGNPTGACAGQSLASTRDERQGSYSFDCGIQDLPYSRSPSHGRLWLRTLPRRRDRRFRSRRAMGFWLGMAEPTHRGRPFALHVPSRAQSGSTSM